jgi:hypothetical protein
MRALLFVILAGTLGAWFYRSTHPARPRPDTTVTAAQPLAQSTVPAEREPASPVEGALYRCDGRTYCSQMHSCEEAKWMLQHCSGMKMDGNNDGVPCEKQWCN